MSDRGDLLTESDDLGGNDDRGSPSSLPDGLSGQNVSVPSARNARGGEQDAGERYEIIETDPRSRPLSDGGADGAQPRGDEGRSAEPERPPYRDRENRRDRRDRQREGRDRTLAENSRLRAQLDELQQWRQQFEPQVAERFTEFDQSRHQNQIADIDRQIQEQAQLADRARRRMAEAVTNQDADTFSAALDERDRATIATQQLTTRKNLVSQGYQVDENGIPRLPPQRQTQRPDAAQQAAPPPPRPLPPVAQEYVRDFAASHAWFNPNNPNDFDSSLVMKIDLAVAADGYDPSSAEYWDEMEDRMRQYLPHRFQQQTRAAQQQRQQQPAQRPQQPPPERRGPMTAGGNDRPAQPGTRQVYLSPDRKQSLIEIGVMDREGRVADQAKFTRYLKQFSEYDRANGVAR